LVTLDVWETIRLRCVRDREPIKRVARELGISKNTVKKYVQSLKPPQMKAAERSSQLEPYQSQIDNWLRTSPHITAIRIGALLREQYGELVTGERALRYFVANRRRALIPREAFIRAVYTPGAQAQFDFTPVSVNLAGVLVVLQLFVMRLSYSGRLFARVSWRCDQPALFAGMLEALTAFEGVPRSAVFDNASTAVKRVLSGRSRDENLTFRAFAGSLAMPIAFAAPAKGNEKGGVEGANHYLQDNFFTPVLEAASVDEINTSLAAFCIKDQLRTHSVHHEVIAERFARELVALRSLPNPLPRACVTHPVHVNKFSEITVDTNRYCVPTKYAHRSAFVEIYDSHLRAVVDDSVVAEFPRLTGRNQMYSDIRHSVDLLAHKHRASLTAAVVSDGRLPEAFLTLRDRYLTRSEGHATKAWTTVLLLLKEHTVDVVEAAISQAIIRGTDDPAAIALLVCQNTQTTTENTLNLNTIPSVPRGIVAPVDLNAYSNAELVERAS
jgi:transposase